MVAGICPAEATFYALPGRLGERLLVSGLLPGGLAWAEVGPDRRWLLDCRPVVVEPCVRMASWTLAWGWLGRVLNVYLAVVSLLVGALFVVDLILYGFWGFRLDATLFFYMESPADALASVSLPFVLVGLAVLFAYGIAIYGWFRWLLVPRAPSSPEPRRWLSSVVLVLLGGLMFIAIRGGVTTSTANVGMVYYSQDQFLNHSAINPCFSLFSSLSKQQDFASQFDFFPEDKRQELASDLTRPFEAASGDTIPRLLRTDRPNILLILLESFSANAIEALGGTPGVTPCLNRLSEEGILFTNMYANSFRTDRGLVSVLNGYLAQPTTSIMKYPAKSQSLPSLAKSLGEVGYTADMLYGGDINFTNMRSFFFSSGYTRITCDQDFPLSSRLSKWGANDDVTFRHLLEDLSARPVDGAPWLTTFLTLSSHEPFEVPYHRLSDPYLNSVAFTDSCLGAFIDDLKELPVWKNTLVILVSDHGYCYPENLTNYEPRRYHIPMLWLGGAVAAPRKVETFACQTDLAVTLLGQLGLPVDRFTFSKNIFSPSEPHFAFYTYNNGFGIIDTTGYSAFDNEAGRVLSTKASLAGEALRVDKGKALLQTLYDDLGSR